LRSSITIVASPRPRVGKTLLARLLTDYLVQNAQTPIGFDVGGGDGGLSDYLPEHATLASLDGVPEQMALFDALIAADGHPKIVDLGADAFEDFFTLADQFDFAAETRFRGIGVALMYIVTQDRTSLDAARALLRRFPQVKFTPVHNEVFGTPPHRQIDSIRAHEPLLKLPALAPSARKYIEVAPFSFTSENASADGHAAQADVDDWLRRIWRDLREFELRALASDLQPLRAGS
jgi:hypothetical protein